MAAFCASASFSTDTATTEIYTLSVHDALPISCTCACRRPRSRRPGLPLRARAAGDRGRPGLLRSEEHTSELQSLTNLVCSLLLEKKKSNASSTGGRRRRRNRQTFVGDRCWRTP